MYIEHQCSHYDNRSYKNVIFRISISKHIQPNVLYANIYSVSPFVPENEYLLSMSSIFRIGRIMPFSAMPLVSIVDLELVDKNDPQITHFTQLLERDGSNENDDMSEIGYAIANKLYPFKYMRKLLKETQLNIKCIQSILLHYHMGIIYGCLDQSQMALEEFKTSIELIRNVESNGHRQDDLCLVPLYANLGLTYQQKNSNGLAFNHAFRALGIVTNNSNNSIYKDEIFASVYCNLGSILRQQGQISEALNYYQQAFNHQCNYLINNHPDVENLQSIITSLTSIQDHSDG